MTPVFIAVIFIIGAFIAWDNQRTYGTWISPKQPKRKSSLSRRDYRWAKRTGIKTAKRLRRR